MEVSAISTSVSTGTSLARVDDDSAEQDLP
jgi:hypothetical protein